MRARPRVFGITLTVWLAVCAAVLWSLMRRAAEAPPGTIDEYARTKSFQLANFAVGYLPSLVVVLVVVLGAEYAYLRMTERPRSRPERLE